VKADYARGVRARLVPDELDMFEAELATQHDDNRAHARSVEA
jgi:hypothetical protein